MPGNRLGNTSEEQALQTCASLRAENDQIRVPFRGNVKNPGSWFPFANPRLYPESCVTQRLRLTSDHVFRSFPLFFADFHRFWRITR